MNLAEITEEELNMLPPHIQDLIKYRKFDPNKPVREDDYVLYYQTPEKMIPVAAKSNIVLITGLPKSRKSTLIKCILASRYTDDINRTLGFKLDLPEGSNILDIDSEMGMARVYKNNQKFLNICNSPQGLDTFHSYSLRPFSPMQRVEQIGYLVEQLHSSEGGLGAIVIDGIADLSANVNERDSCNEAINCLMRWSDRTGSLILTAIHTNRSGLNSTGVLGSQLDKKCDASFLVTKDSDTKISKVDLTLSRESDIPPVLFKHNEQGYPQYIASDDQFGGNF